MVERNRGLNVLCHLLLLASLLLMLLPVYFALLAASQSSLRVMQGGLHLWPGTELWQHIKNVWFGVPGLGAKPGWLLLLNSFLMASSIALAKVFLALGAAYAVVFFKFKGRVLFFWLIFLTLMLPIQVRIIPTYVVIVDLHLLNHFSGIVLPLVASATATFMFRQFFMTIPPSLVEAAKMDGAGPWRFFCDVILPLSQSNMIALFIVMFVYGWNQFLWPLIAASSNPNLHTMVMGLQAMSSMQARVPPWGDVMAAVLLATLPPVLVVVVLQRWFVKGLIDADK